MARQRRGPRRHANSKVKVRCAYKACRSGRDVKNVGMDLRLAPKDVCQELCRPVRGHAHTVRFCCQAHVARCRTMAKTPQEPRGGRVALEAYQVGELFNVLLVLGHIWAAVLMLVQCFMGERADCARSAKSGWFSNLSPEAPGLPTISIPSVNGKQKLGMSLCQWNLHRYCIHG